jgi:hypothetical protein
MSTSEKTISNLIRSQFPAFYNESGPTLIAFVEAYYEWMQQTGNPISQSRNLLEYNRIDSTLDEFLVHFNATYLQGIQYTSVAQKKLTVKKILDLYRAKGSIRALKLLFRLVFAEDIEVYLPGADIIKSSDGTWNVPQYLEISYSTRNQSYVGKQVTGVASGATAVIDRLVRRKAGSKVVDLFFITNVSEKNFQTGELLKVDNNLDNVPIIIGSLSSLIVDNGGVNFAVGDIVSLSSNVGQQGTARVSEIEDITGIVRFKLEPYKNANGDITQFNPGGDGGWGYSNLYSNVFVSTTVLTYSNSQLSISFTGQLNTNTTVTTVSNTYGLVAGQTITANIVGIPASTTIASVVNTSVITLSAAATASGNATLTANATSSNTFLQKFTGVTFNNTANSLTPVTANVFSFSNTKMGVINLSGALPNTYTRVYTSRGNLSGNATITNISTGINANIAIGTVNSTETVFYYTDEIGGHSGGVSTLSAVVISGTAGQFTCSATTLAVGDHVIITGTLGGTGTITGYITDTKYVVSSVTGTVGAITGFTLTTENNAAIVTTTGTPTGLTYTINYAYLTLPLNTTAYGFPIYPFCNVNTGALVDILNLRVLQVGEIQNIITTNLGKEYNEAPFVNIYQKGVATLQKQDYYIDIANVVGSYSIGEEIKQNVSTTEVQQLILNSPSGAFEVNEYVYQVNSTPAGTYIANNQSNILEANTGAPNFSTTFAAGQKIVINTGGTNSIRIINNVATNTSLYLTAATANSNTHATVSILKNVGVAVGLPASAVINFANTGNTAWVNTANVFGLTSNATSAIISVQGSIYVTAIGKVKEANSTQLSVRRRSLADFSISGNSIIGLSSGASSNAAIITIDTASGFSGDNANVSANVVTGNGSVTALSVVSSGIGYNNAEIVTFTSVSNTQLIGTARTQLGKQGIGAGYYSSTKGFLSSDKYIQDGNYYQTFSYEINSSRDVSTYFDMVKAVVHTAGTALYGKVIKKSTVSTTLNIITLGNGPIQE